MIVEAGYELLEKLEETADFKLVRACREGDVVPVLLKVLRAEGANRAEVARFKHQYERIARLTSPHLVAVHRVEELAGALIVVLEDFPGRDLAQILAARPSRRMPLGEALDLATSLAEGLAAVHAAGLIHRDLRPHNVLVGACGAVKITSFGADAEITRAHERLYAPAVLAEVLPYVSPEQTGRMNRGVDYRTDLYALGVILYQMLTGQRPFEAQDPMELIHAHLALAPAPPSRVDPTIPEAVSAVVLKLLAKNAEDRYQSAEGLLADLERCREGPRAAGTIAPFIAGQRDRQDLFRIPQKLYGRAHDIEALTSAFERALEGSREVVLVSGYSGIGKSSLVHEILKPLARQKGYFTSGKYDQYSRGAPYSAVIQAFDGLVRQMLTESEARILRWRSAILEALGPNGQVVCDVIPSLSHVIGPQLPVPALDPLEAQNRLNRCFLQFVSAFARHAHPLVLFLDDLQRIDPASLGLLRALLADDSLEALFFCGAYRDNEVSPAHPFVRAIEELERAGVIVRDIVLTPLARPHLLEMLSDSLKRDDCGPFADAVQRKTGGNPFFVKEFVRSLRDHGVLTHAAGSGWRWDLARIDALAYTDNVVDLMVRTIARLPATTQAALKLAAAIGNQFELDVLATVSECSLEEAYGRLDPAVSEGLVGTGRSGYRFAHDKVQEGAYAMIPGADRPAFHLRIGQLLAGKLDLSEGQNLFDVVGHLNSAGDLVSAPAERLRLARMSFEAACRAEDAAAFGAALRYLKLGLLRLPEDAWTSQYPLRLRYAMKTALMLSLSGLHDEALALLSDCLTRATSRLDRTEVLRLKMNVQVLKNDLPAALAEGLAALRPFGIDLPAFPDEAMVDAQIRATMDLVWEKTLEALPDLPPLEDPEILAMRDVLQELYVPCYFLATNNLGITVAKILENTLRHGLSRHAIFGCINFGMGLCARDDIALGYRFGRAAIDLWERSPDKKSEAMLRNMWGGFVQHWREGYLACKDSLLAGMHAGLETGQYIWAFYNASNSVTNSLLRGLPLSDLLAEARSYQPICELDECNAITWMIAAIGQLAHQLSNETTCPASLKGAWVDIDEVIEEARRIDNQASRFFAYFYAVVLYVFQGAFEDAARTALSLNIEIPAVEAWHGTPAFHGYAGVALTQAADVVSPGERALFLARAEMFAEKLSRWAELCPENLSHRRALLRAELERVRGDTLAAWHHYDEAIALAQRGGYLHDEALANELAGRCFCALGKTTIARAYLTEAHRAYGRWGATEAMRRLERAYPDLVPSEILRGAKGLGAAASAGAALDMSSVLKASQAISGEIVLDRLLDALMRILVENAGARRGVLLLLHDGRLVVEAEHRVGEAAVHMLGATPLEDRSDVPSSVITYVARTRETVLLDDRTTDGPFGRDRCFAHAAPRSSLAAPIVHKGHLAGVIYLENDLTRSAFTPDHVEIIRLLSAQAAVSIENALLLAKEQAARAAAEDAERRAAFLAKAGVLLSESLDYEETFARLGRLCVQQLADWCAIDVVEGREIRRLAVAHRDPVKERLLRQVQERYPPRWDSPHPAAKVLRTGEPVLTPELTDEGLRTLCHDDEHYRLARAVGTRTGLSVPLIARGQTLGVLNLASDVPGRPFGRADLDLAEEVARRAAIAIDNARLYRASQEAVRARSEFLTVASHELNTPVTSLMLTLQSLRRARPSGRPADLQVMDQRLELASRQATRLARLINDLLDVSRIEAGPLPLDRTDVDLGALVREVASRFEADLAQSRCSVSIRTGAPVVGRWDPSRIDRVVTNLLSNAIKFGKNRPIEVFVGADRGVARLAVRDHGIGIAPEQCDRIFGRFERAVSDRHYGGLGLGLYISRRLVEDHGGSIRCDSQPGAGATFTVELPCAGPHTMFPPEESLPGRPVGG
ncbi:Signal transduction histidine kinase CheA [Minicystis rosea]|nr:Signal transduction histidine kinase CheA [Minicystis rosea]